MFRLNINHANTREQTLIFSSKKVENIFANLKSSAYRPVESMPTWYLFKGKLFTAIENMCYYFDTHDLNVNPTAL